MILSQRADLLLHSKLQCGHVEFLRRSPLVTYAREQGGPQGAKVGSEHIYRIRGVGSNELDSEFRHQIGRFRGTESITPIELLTVLYHPVDPASWHFLHNLIAELRECHWVKRDTVYSEPPQLLNRSPREGQGRELFQRRAVQHFQGHWADFPIVNSSPLHPGSGETVVVSEKLDR